ncbi:MAG TPA: energy transducer TonB, partial [Sunxiuqinia sp.]|nr:energy transducer TonB [Sunxiuqinia sp.]
MKTLITFLLCMIVSICSFGQSQTRHIVNEVEVSPPTFKGAINQQIAPSANFNTYIANNVEFPQADCDKNKEGTEVIQFVISQKGEVTNFKVINSISTGIDEEVIRVLKSTNGMWDPGTNNGTPVDMQKEVAVAFISGLSIDEAFDKNFYKIARYYFIEGSKKLLYRNNAKKALLCYNNGIKYMPNDAALIAFRG